MDKKREREIEEELRELERDLDRADHEKIKARWRENGAAVLPPWAPPLLLD